MSVNLTRYSGVYLTATIAIIALSVVLSSLFAFDLPPGLATIVPAMSAAQMEGVQYARTHRARADSAGAWRAALAMTAIAFLFSAVLLIVQLSVPGVVDVLSGVPRGVLLGLFALVMLIVFLTNRLFLTLGMNAELRRQARSGGKD